MAATGVLLRVLYGSGTLPTQSTATEGSMYVSTTSTQTGGIYNGSLYFDLDGKRYQIQSAVADHVANSLTLQLNGTQLGETFNGSASRTWNIPLASGNTVGLVSGAAQTFNGVKTFANGIVASAASTFNNTVAIKNTATVRSIAAETGGQYDIGTSSAKFKNVYAANFKGNADTATTATQVGHTLTFKDLAGNATQTFNGAANATVQLTDLISAGETLPLSMIPQSAIERIFTVADKATALTKINAGEITMGDLIQVAGDKTYYVTQDLTHDVNGAARTTPVTSFANFTDCTAEFTAGTASVADHVGHKLTLTINSAGSKSFDGSANVAFDIPLAGTGTTGVVGTGAQSFAGNKTFTGNTTLSGTLTVNSTTALNDTATTQTIVPKTTNTYNLGSSSALWKDIYATTFHGALDGNAATATQTGHTLTFSNSASGYSADTFNGSANVTLGTFKPASESSTKAGLVPAPTAGSTAQVLRSNGKWANIVGESGITVTSTGNSNGEFKFTHTNSVTAKTSYQGQSSNVTINVGSAAGSFTVPAITYDAQGHITGSTVATISLSKLTVTQHLTSGLKVATVGTTDIYAGVEWETFP